MSALGKVLYLVTMQRNLAGIAAARRQFERVCRRVPPKSLRSRNNKSSYGYSIFCHTFVSCQYTDGSNVRQNVVFKRPHAYLERNIRLVESLVASLCVTHYVFSFLSLSSAMTRVSSDSYLSSQEMETFATLAEAVPLPLLYFS